MRLFSRCPERTFDPLLGARLLGVISTALRILESAVVTYDRDRHIGAGGGCWLEVDISGSKMAAGWLKDRGILSQCSPFKKS